MTFRSGIKQVGFIASIVLLGGCGGILLDRVVFPWLSVQKGLDRIAFLKGAVDNVTIINKTEQILIREDDSLGNIVSQPATSVVALIPKTSTSSERSGVLSVPRSGVLLTNDGVIATYREATTTQDEPQSFIALLFDGSYHDVRLLGWDPLTNLEFFRIDGVSDTPAISLAHSDDALVGKKLIALLSADRAYQNRFVTGTLDAIRYTFNLSGKTVASSEKWEGVFEGNFEHLFDSVGGPVIQYNGEMIGILGGLTIDQTMKTFIIPSKAVQQSLDFVLSENKIRRPVFGAYYISITQAYALQHSLRRTEGARIYSPSGRTGLAIISGGVADKASIQANDIIVSINGTPLTLDNPLSVALSPFKPGDTITITLDRSGSMIDVVSIL